MYPFASLMPMKNILKTKIPLLFIFFFSISIISLAEGRQDSLERAIKTGTVDSLKIQALNSLSDLLLYNSPDSALAKAKAALALSEETHYIKGKSDALYLIGKVYLEKLNNLPLALQMFTEGERLSEQHKNYSTLAACLGGIGTVYFYQNDFTSAFKYYSSVLDIAEKQKDKRLQSKCLNNLGLVLLNQKDYEKSRGYFLKGYVTALFLNDTAYIARCYYNIALTYVNELDYDEAFIYYNKIIDLYKTASPDKDLLVDVYINIGEYYRVKKNYTEAIKSLNASLQLAIEVKSKNQMMFIYETLSETYRDMGKYKEALQYHELYSTWKDSTLNEANTKIVQEIQTKYESEKKEKAIQILGAEREAQEGKIQNQRILIYSMVIGLLLIIFLINLRVKNKRIKLENQLLHLEHKALSLQMNPHFIFNCLNSISSFISQSNHMIAKSYLAKFGRLMRLTLEQSRQEFIPLHEEIEILENYMELEKIRFEKEFSYQIILEDDLDPDSCMVPPMLIQPHIENAIIHGLTARDTPGELKISFNKYNSDTIRCIVDDNGVGRNPDKKTGKHKSLAVEIMKERYQIMNLKRTKKLSIFIEDKKDSEGHSKGTAVVFDLPISTE